MSTEAPSDARSWAIRFPELHQLFAGYFNQDWQQDGLNADETLRMYLVDAPPATLAVAREEVLALLALGLDDGELAPVLHPGLGSFRVPSLACGSNGAWLEEISADLTRALEGRITTEIEHIPVERIGPDPGELVGASSFPDRATAQQAVQDAINWYEEGISAWLEEEGEAGLRFAISHDTGHAVGRLLTRRAHEREEGTDDVTGVRVVLERSPGSPYGFRLVSAYPDVI